MIDPASLPRTLSHARDLTFLYAAIRPVCTSKPGTYIRANFLLYLDAGISAPSRYASIVVRDLLCSKSLSLTAFSAPPWMTLALAMNRLCPGTDGMLCMTPSEVPSLSDHTSHNIDFQLFVGSLTGYLLNPAVKRCFGFCGS